MTSAKSLCHYKAAIALNNDGVTLLELGAFRQAMDTFKDSINVIKTTFCPTTPPIELVNEKLFQARQRLLFTEPMRLVYPMEFIAHDENDLSSMKSAFQYGPSSTLAFPIRIRCHDLDLGDEHSVDMESAIILHNFAISHCCLARCHKASKQEQLQKGALKLYNLGFTIIDRQSNSAKDIVQKAQTLLLSTMLLNNIVQVLTEMGNIEEARATYRRCVELGAVVSKMDALDFLGPLVQTTAASA